MDEGDLQYLNKHIKRRLQIVNRINYSFLVDSRRRRVDSASLMGMGIITLFRDHLPRDPFFELEREMFEIKVNDTINRNQVETLLGYDYRTSGAFADENDIRSMLKAIRRGFGGERANAYVLGQGFERKEEIEIPVAFYKIPKKTHQSLTFRR